MDEFDVTVVLPAYNEEKRLERCISETVKIFDNLGIKYEVIIVENGSTDNTFQIAKKFSQKYSFVQAIHLENPNLVGALRKGYKLAKGKVVVNYDIDLATDMSHVKELLEFSKDYDFVTGSRYLDKKMVNRTFGRNFVSHVFNWFFVRGLLRSKIKDNNIGFKAIKREIGVKLYDEVENEDIFGYVELIILAQRHNYRIKEFPVQWKENPSYLKISFKDIMRYMVPSIKLWWKLDVKKKK